MAYCRFSTDDFQCDLYVYGDCHGGFTTHVACNRPVFKESLPPFVPLDASTTDGFNRWYQRHQKVMALIQSADRVPIGLPCDGQTFNDPDEESCIYRLKSLEGMGYRFPPEVVEELQQEAAERGSAKVREWQMSDETGMRPMSIGRRLAAAVACIGAMSPVGFGFAVEGQSAVPDIDRKCLECSKEFTGTKSYCSADCCRKHRTKKRRK